MGAIVLVSGLGCRLGVPVADPEPLASAATISGTVRGPEGTSAVEGRVVEVVNIETGERQRVATNRAGGFTVRVKPGKYRAHVALRDGESLVRQPRPIELHPSDIARADFVIGSVRVSTPRSPGSQHDPALLAPVV